MPDTIAYEEYGNLYLNITNRCTARCEFCIKFHTDGVYGYNLRLSKEPAVDEIITALQQHNLSQYNEVVFAGFGEPLTRLDDVLTIIKWLKQYKIFVRIDTIGHVMLYYPKRDVVAELKASGLNAVSISLNAHDENTYDQLCHPSKPEAYQSVLKFARQSQRAGIRTRLTVVKLPTIDVKKCQKIAEELGVDFKIRG